MSSSENESSSGRSGRRMKRPERRVQRPGRGAGGDRSRDSRRERPGGGSGTSGGRSRRPGGQQGSTGKPARGSRYDRGSGSTGKPVRGSRYGRGSDPAEKPARGSRYGGGSGSTGKPARGSRYGRGGGSTGKPARGSRYGRGSGSAGKSQRKTRRPHRSTGASSGHTADQQPHLRDEIRINKFIAHAGFCSRRDADEKISEGQVYVNGKRVTEHGVKVKPTDKVVVEGQTISLEPFVYILLNKSRDTISTTSDEKGRNTVSEAVEDATGYRVYPVGRLDRDTMGLLVMTNDGDLAHRLMHPSYQVKKVYEVATSRPLGDDELRQLVSGIELEDGPVKPERVLRSVVDPSVLEITVTEGRNHLIRRMIGWFGAEVVKLKRVRYAGLTDKNLRPGRWRYLKMREINDLRRMVKLQPLDFMKEQE